jgi:hypothetical protein
MVSASSLHHSGTGRRGRHTLAVAVVFLLIVFGGAIWQWNTATETAAACGAVSGLLGMVVGAYVGADVASASLDRLEQARRDAEAARARAEMRALRLAGAMDPGWADTLLREPAP